MTGAAFVRRPRISTLRIAREVAPEGYAGQEEAHKKPMPVHKG